MVTAVDGTLQASLQNNERKNYPIKMGNCSTGENSKHPERSKRAPGSVLVSAGVSGVGSALRNDPESSKNCLKKRYFLSFFCCTKLFFDHHVLINRCENMFAIVPTGKKKSISIVLESKLPKPYASTTSSPYNH